MSQTQKINKNFNQNDKILTKMTKIKKNQKIKILSQTQKTINKKIKILSQTQIINKKNQNIEPDTKN